MTHLITTLIGPSSESAEGWRAVRRGVDCGTGGGSFMARKGSNDALSPKPNPSVAVVGAPVLSPHGEAAVEGPREGATSTEHCAIII